MLIDDLQELLKQNRSEVETIQASWANAKLEEQFEKLEHESQQEDFWKNPKQTEISKELQRVRILRERYQEVIKYSQELPEMLELFQDDENQIKQIEEEVKKYIKATASLKVNLLLTDPRSDTNTYLNINAGAGGTESQDWANMLLRMYLRFCERERLAVQIMDIQSGEQAGIKSATLFIRGKNAYGMLKSEQGVHRLVRISPFDASKRRHTSFAGIFLTPEVPDIEVVINAEDLRIDTYRSSGAGGQHVNVTDSAVRITHLPTNIVAQCQNERSQTQNKETAMKMLKSRIAQKMEEDRDAEIQAGSDKKKIEWGSQIRSYVLHPYKMVKDHRTGIEVNNVDAVLLDGEIDDFIVAEADL